MTDQFKIPIPGTGRKGSLTIDAEIADAVRRIAAAEGRSRELSSVVRDMVRIYLQEKHPEWV